MPFNPEKYNNGFKHKLKADSEKEYLQLKIHIDGEYPQKLIDERRPSEPLHIKEFRKKIFEHTSMPIINKPIESLGKIRRSVDWDIKFVDADQPARIRVGENLKDYITEGFPYFKSLSNWLWSVLHKQLCVDANALCLVMPSEKEWSFKANDIIKPYPYIFNSDQWVDFVPGEYAVVKSSDTSTYTTGNVVKYDGAVYFYSDREVIQRWEQDDKGKLQLRGEFKHNTGKLHAWKIGGLVKKASDGDFLMTSRLYPMIPRLNKLIREDSDLDAGVVQHLFLERWEKASQQCGSCKGIGEVRVEGELVKCPNKKCKDGLIIPSPYETKIIGKTRNGEFPEPPYAGYIEKDPKIIEIQDKRIDDHGYKALAAINMEFLADTPLNESGKAKEVDRDEIKNFASAHAEDVVRNGDNVTESTADLRYYIIVPNLEERKKMLPTIPVPDKFDILTSNVLMEGISKMRESKINPMLIVEAEKELAGKQFNADPKVKSRVELILGLDPLAGRSEEDKMMMLNNKGISPLTYIISSNIIEFVDRAIEENAEFPKMKRAAQKAIILAYAKEVEKTTSQVEKVLPGDEGSGDQGGG